METRTGNKTNEAATTTESESLPRSNPLPIPPPNRQRIPLRSAVAQSAHSASQYSTSLSSFMLDKKRLEGLANSAPTHYSSSDSSSDDDDESEDEEKKSKVKEIKEPTNAAASEKPRNTVLNIFSGGSPLKVTISPPVGSALGNLTPPLLNLSPLASPNNFHGSLRVSRSRSPSRTPSAQRERFHELLDHSGNTILNILGGTPNLTLTISPQPSSLGLPHLPPIITLSPQNSPPSSPTASKHSPRQQEDLAAEQKQGIQIILPGDDPLIQWAIDLREAKTSPTHKPDLSHEAASLLHPLQIQPLGPSQPLQRAVSINPDLEEEKRCKELLQDIAYHILLIALVSPNAMNAFCEPSGVKPANINAEWWNSLTPEIQMLSIINAIFSLGVNVFVQRDFIPQALKELKESFGKCFSSLSDFLGNSLTLISSSAAAFSFAAMSYEAFKWLGDVASVIPGLASLGTSFATRYPSVKKGAQKIRLFFNKDMRFQKEMADKLRHLKQGYVSNVNLLIRTKNYRLNGKDINALLEDLGSEFDGIPLEELLSKKTNLEFIKEYAEFILEISFATLIASTAFETFTQKGFDGANAVSHLLGHSLEHLDRSDQFSLGAVGGLVSAILYYIAALNFIPTISYVASELTKDLLHAIPQLARHPIDTIKGTIQEPQRLFRFLKLAVGIVAVWRSSGAMVTVGSGVSSNQKGIFWPLFQFWEGYAKIFPALNGLGGIAINMTSTINQILKQEREEKRKKPQLEDVARYLEEALLPQASQLKQFSLFNTSSARSVPQQEAVNSNSRIAANESAFESELPLMEDPDLDARPACPSVGSRLKQFCTFFKSGAATSAAQLEMANRKPREVASEDEDEYDPELPLLEDVDLENPRSNSRPRRSSTHSPRPKLCTIM